MTSRRRRARAGTKSGQRGAALVEFALVGPLLMALLFGIIEFSWIFNQVLDVRHGSREGARLVAVNYQAGPSPTAQTAAIIATICARVDEPSKVRVTITLETAGADEPGDVAFVRVERDLEQLTGFFDVFLRNVQPNAETAFLLEQNATWSPSVGEKACT